MKKSIIFLVVGLLIGLCLVGSASAISGSGTSSDPYILSSTSDLALLSGDNYASYAGSGVYFELGADIDFEGGSFTPIGSSTYLFNGNFDGKDHVISNMDITSSSGYSGFFSYVTGAAQISNIVFRDCSVTETSSSYCGMLLGRLQGGSGASISNIETDGCLVVSSSSYVGGIAGYGAYSSSGTVTYSGCYVHDGKVQSSSSYVGGIAGYGAASSSGTITYSNCTVEREVVLSSSRFNVGGIAGVGAFSSSAVRYTDCKVLSCVIKASSYNVGGIAGIGANSSSANYTNCQVDNSYIMSSSSNHVGGIAGFVNNSSSSYSVNASGCSVTNCTIYGSGQVAGIFGYFKGSGTVTSPVISHNNIISSGGTYCGGVIGQNA